MTPDRTLDTVTIHGHAIRLRPGVALIDHTNGSTSYWTAAELADSIEESGQWIDVARKAIEMLTKLQSYQVTR